MREKYSGEELFLAWMAGFWEGEGSFSLKERNGKVSGSEIQIGQVRREPLDLIQSKFTGRVYLASKGGGRTIYMWHLTLSSTVVDLLERLLPFMKFRARQVREKLGVLKKAMEIPGSRFHWTEGEKLFILQHSDLTNSELASHLSRTVVAVRDMKAGLRGEDKLL